MTGLRADLRGLDACRRTMLRQAGQFGAIADGFSGRGVDSSMFGTLAMAAHLAEICRQMDTAAGQQFAAAERFLRGVERGLDDVRQGVADAEEANLSAIWAI